MAQQQDRIHRIEVIRIIIGEALKRASGASKDALMAQIMVIWGCSRRTALEYIDSTMKLMGLHENKDGIICR